MHSRAEVTFIQTRVLSHTAAAVSAALHRAIFNEELPGKSKPSFSRIISCRRRGSLALADSVLPVIRHYSREQRNSKLSHELSFFSPLPPPATSSFSPSSRRTPALHLHDFLIPGSRERFFLPRFAAPPSNNFFSSSSLSFAPCFSFFWSFCRCDRRAKEGIRSVGEEVARGFRYRGAYTPCSTSLIP